MTYTSTRLLLNNSPDDPLTLSIHWLADEDGHGWEGACTVWRNDRKVASGYRVQIRQGQPLGSIYVDLDPCNGGCWMSLSINGVSITERDLQWATVFAAAAIQHKRAYLKQESLSVLRNEAP